MSGLVRTRLSRGLRALTLGAVLAVSLVLVPDSSVHTREVELVKVDRAGAVDVDPETVWILALGSDMRPGEDMLRTRADAIQLVGLNTRTGAATSIGIPRDSWVPIPGFGSNRVNAALTFGGPQLMGETVGDLVGVQPDYVFVTRFPFFEDMVDDIGGITVDNPFYFNDEILKPKGFAGGQGQAQRLRRDGVRADPQDAAQRRLRTLGEPAAGAARHPQHRARPRRGAGLHRARRAQRAPAHAHRPARRPSSSASGRRSPRSIPAKISTCVLQGSIGNVGSASWCSPTSRPPRRRRRPHGRHRRADRSSRR